MAEVMIASLSPIGHVGPLLNVAQGLVDRGDRVTVLTSAAHAAKIRAIGAWPHPLPPEADFDETRLDIDLPGRADTSDGLDATEVIWRRCRTRRPSCRS